MKYRKMAGTGFSGKFLNIYIYISIYIYVYLYIYVYIYICIYMLKKIIAYLFPNSPEVTNPSGFLSLYSPRLIPKTSSFLCMLSFFDLLKAQSFLFFRSPPRPL